MTKAEESTIDEKSARQISMICQTDDIKEMQRQYRVWFDPRPGEILLDVGCGTGVNDLALSKLVGPAGKITGIDNSEAMLTIAREQASANNIEYQLKAVEEIDFPENSFDGIVCTQVLEYLEDPVKVLRSLVPLIKPTGRIFVAETDWDTLIYNIPDKQLQRKVTMEFSDHHGGGWVGRQLYDLCRHVVSTDIELHPYVIHNTEYSVRRYGGPLSYVIRDYLLRTGKCTPGEVQSWLQQLSEAFDNRTYFFAQTRFVCILRK